MPAWATASQMHRLLTDKSDVLSGSKAKPGLCFAVLEIDNAGG